MNRLATTCISLALAAIASGASFAESTALVTRKKDPSSKVTLTTAEKDITGVTQNCAAGELLTFTQEALVAPDGGAKLGRAVIYSINGNTPTICRSISVNDAGAIPINPSRIWCNDNKALVKGGFALVTNAAATEGVCLRIQEAGNIIPNSDYGFALNLINRSEDDSEFAVEEGFSGYWAFSRLRNRYFRPTINLSLLDFDTARHDVEVGLGVGFVFKTDGLATESGKGLSLGVGYGRNLMIRDDDGADYWYIGIGFNVNNQKAQD